MSTKLQRILFWEDRPGQRPQDFIRRDVLPEDRIFLAHALRNGQMGQAYKGIAKCRICGAPLGSSDMTGLGFIWPQKAEHYIEHESVWTPGCDQLLAACAPVARIQLALEEANKTDRQKLDELIAKIETIVPYVTATLGPGCRGDVHVHASKDGQYRDQWVEIHLGRCGSSERQLEGLLKLAREMKP